MRRKGRNLGIGIFALALVVFLAGPALTGGTMTIKDAVAGGFVVEGDTYDIIQIKNPAPGEWRIDITGVSVSTGAEPYTLQVAGKESRVRTEWVLNAPVPEVGAPFTVAVRSTEEINWDRSEVTLIYPDGSESRDIISLGGVVVVR